MARNDPSGYTSCKWSTLPGEERSFQGYRRPDHSVAIRNELWIIPMVGCVNTIAQHLAWKNQGLVTGSVEGVYALTNPLGCRQSERTDAWIHKLFAALAHHPHAGGVLFLGLDCADSSMKRFEAELREWDANHVQFLFCQQSENEIAAGTALLTELAAYAGSFQRQHVPVEELIVGVTSNKDSANPVVSHACQSLDSAGSTVVMLDHCDHDRHDGNHVSSALALATAGAHIHLFASDQGSPFSTVIPTIKIATNAANYEKKEEWFDFNAGTATEGKNIRIASEQLLTTILHVASGKPTRSESYDVRGIT